MIKALEIKTSMLLIQILLTILFYYASFSYFLIIDLYFLVSAVIAQIFNPVTEIVVSVEIPSKGAKAEIEIHSVIAEAKIREISI